VKKIDEKGLEAACDGSDSALVCVRADEMRQIVAVLKAAKKLHRALVKWSMSEAGEERRKQLAGAIVRFDRAYEKANGGGK